MSGGLDSTLAATLLKKDCHDVIGIHFLTGFAPPGAPPESTPNSPVCLSSAEMAAQRIGIPLEVIDCSQSFRKEVIDYFIQSYRRGQTPNPCVVCNERIKFGVILDHAKRLGASALATGHYAKRDTLSTGRPCLLKGTDPVKDQSYFLARLTEKQLSQAIFPLAGFTKQQVRDMARHGGYTAFSQEESQELCFVHHPSYRDFLSDVAPFHQRPGPIVNTRGDVLGQHRGLFAYTIGQRRGLGIPGPEPYYVLRLDNAKNTLVIGTKDELTCARCIVTHINWIGMDPPAAPMVVRIRIRYRHQEVDAMIDPLGPREVRVSFSTPQEAVTPGQAAVFYHGNRILGGGWIAL
jgi:tRNA-specific 2-thiouridylase